MLDAELIERPRHCCGTPDYLREFELTAMPFFAQVKRTARHMVGDEAWAKDLTQEVFLQAWKSFDRFQPGTNCKAWLMTILFHVCQHHRRRNFRGPTISWGPEHDEIVAVHPSKSSCLTNPALIAALAALPEWYKRVLILAEVYEFSYAEISAMLKIPMGTVMSRLNRGKKMLRCEMAAHGRR
jgi:RNA polymerase sigma-70 factor, ECF subfamily